MPTNPRLHLDAPWKAAFKRYFPQMLHFYFQEYWSLIAWSQKLSCLEQELEKTSFDSHPATIIADKLVQVIMRGDGEPKAIVHVEAQSKSDPKMAERMCRYGMRILCG